MIFILLYYNLKCEIERYRSLAPMYYRGAAAAVIVFDITKKVFININKYLYLFILLN